MKKKILLLIGPKGSGKSFLGENLQARFGWNFLRVEDKAKTVPRSTDIRDEDYLEKVFEVIEEAVRNELEECDLLVFESTGLSVYFDRMLQNLQQDYEVKLVAVHADPETCFQRVAQRDSSIHIPVTQKELEAINREVRSKVFSWDLEVCINFDNQDIALVELNKIIAIWSR